MGGGMETVTSTLNIQRFMQIWDKEKLQITGGETFILCLIVFYLTIESGCAAAERAANGNNSLQRRGRTMELFFVVGRVWQGNLAALVFHWILCGYGLQSYGIDSGEMLRNFGFEAMELITEVIFIGNGGRGVRR